MFYHVSIEVLEVRNKKELVETFYETDHESLDEIKKFITQPYLNKQQIYIDNRFIDFAKIRQLKVLESEKSASDLAEKRQNELSDSIIMLYSDHDMLLDESMKNITKSLLF